MKIKGIPPKKIVSPIQPSFNDSLLSVVQMVNEFNALKETVAETMDTKVEEVEKVIETVKKTSEESEKKLNTKLSEFETKAIGMIKDIQSIPKPQGKDGKDGTDGKDADEKKIVETILSKIPKPNENELIKKIISKIPENKASLKIIQEKFETDPMSIIEKIMALPEGKFKLKTSHIDGLEQTMRAFQSQLGRGYLHGGGDTVVAGTNITITQNANGNKVISSTAGTGTWYQDEIVATGQTGTSFSLAHTPSAVVFLYKNGQYLVSGASYDYTISGKNITLAVALYSSDLLTATYS